MSKFCLILIINEGDNYEIVFENAKNIFNSYLILYIGSSDYYLNNITMWLKNNNKNGEIFYKNLETLDSLTSNLDKNYLFEKCWNSYKDNEYILFLNPNEVILKNINDVNTYLSVEDVDNLYNELFNSVDNSLFYVEEICGESKYQRCQIYKNNKLFRHDRLSDEYLNYEKYKKIDWIYNKNLNQNDEKYINIFSDSLDINPCSIFYLAQSYEKSSPERSFQYYKKYIESNNSSLQEKYISCLKIGKLSEKLEDKIKYWILGTTICPERLECYYELMMYFYNKNEHDKAFAFGSLATASREYNSSFLFVEKYIYDYNFDLNFGVSCYNSKNYKKGMESNIKSKIKAPEHIKKMIENNLIFFNKSLNESLNVSLSERKYESGVSSIIVDNFYENPMELREKILSEESFEVKGNYPGFRTPCQLHRKEFSNIKERFENIIGKKIKYWPEGYNGSFQYVTEEMTSWIHRDATEWSAVIYMSPDAPCNGGTNMYRHKLLKIEYDAEGGEKEIKQLNDDSRNYENWELMDSVGNKFNRCIIFKGKRSHQSGVYFGTDKQTGRLFQTFFFDI